MSLILTSEALPWRVYLPNDTPGRESQQHIGRSGTGRYHIRQAIRGQQRHNRIDLALTIRTSEWERELRLLLLLDLAIH